MKIESHIKKEGIRAYIYLEYFTQISLVKIEATSYSLNKYLDMSSNEITTIAIITFGGIML